MRNRTISQLVAAGAILSFNISALAIEPAIFKIGAFDVAPTLDVDLSDTDNMFKTGFNEVDTRLLILNPRLRALIDDGSSSLSLMAEAIDGDFSATSEDDYTDWRVGASTHLQVSNRNAFELNAGLFSTREMRGTGFSQGGLLPSDPDSYEETTASVSYLYGDTESFFSFVLTADTYDKTYDNNRSQTRFRDREDGKLSATAFFNVSPRTNIVLEYRNIDVDYTTDPNVVIGSPDSLDSEETYAFIGFTWEATAKTTGSIKIGQADKEFSDADRVDADGTVWEASLYWEPLSYSIISFDAVNGYGESVGQGDALETENYNLTWLHEWSDSLYHTFSLYSSDDEYIGSQRIDEFDTLSFRLDYSLRRWLDVNVTVAREERDSSFALFNYKENVISLGFSLSL
jgi:polysaccharide biosynthesis protein VpsM